MTKEELIVKLSDLYANKKWDELINELLNNKSQLPDTMFHYNLGTAFAKLEKFAPARFHFEKSIKLGSFDSSVFNNLNFVNSKLAVYDLKNSESLLDQILNYILLVPWTYVYAILAFISLIVFIFLFKSKISRIRKSIILTIPLLATLVFYLFTSQFEYGIALDEIPLREGPSKIYDEVGLIPSGAKVLITERQNGWYYVSRPARYVGWILKDNFAIY